MVGGGTSTQRWRSHHVPCHSSCSSPLTPLFVLFSRVKNTNLLSPLFKNRLITRWRRHRCHVVLTTSFSAAQPQEKDKWIER
ncbi:unnamed protein product [Musa textilis]